jgi:hypothetical protein
MMTSRHVFRVIRARSLSAAALALATAVVAGCNLELSAGAEARDQWTRNYTLAQGGTVEIREPNGTIRIEAVDGERVDVVAERIARASSDEAAKDLLSKMEIAEDISPNRISLDGTHRAGARILHGSRKVNYTVKVPRWAKVAVHTSNGVVDVAGLAGALRVEATNGSVHARGLESSAQVETTNGTARLEFAKIGDQGITCETTNGTIVVSVPKDARATVSARVTNGAIRRENLSLEVIEQSQRRLDGTLNGGGAEIRLSATNGTIRIEGR